MVREGQETQKAKDAKKVKEQKKITTERRDARRDKISAIDGMVSDAEYLARVSAVATALSPSASPVPAALLSPYLSRSQSRSGEVHLQISSESDAGGDASAADGDETPGKVKGKGMSKHQRRQQRAAQKAQRQEQQQGKEGKEGKGPAGMESDTLASPEATTTLLLPIYKSSHLQAKASQGVGRGFVSSGGEEDEGTDDAFSSCVSHPRTHSQGGHEEEGRGGQTLQSPARSGRGMMSSTSSMATYQSMSNLSVSKQQAQHERDLETFQWYRDAMEEINAIQSVVLGGGGRSGAAAAPTSAPTSGVTSGVASQVLPVVPEGSAPSPNPNLSPNLNPNPNPNPTASPPSPDGLTILLAEGYADYLISKGVPDPKVNTTDNPYILQPAAWWELERTARIAKLNARLSKEKRIMKTGSAVHEGTRESTKTKANRKAELFSLSTNNRFAALKILK